MRPLRSLLPAILAVALLGVTTACASSSGSSGKAAAGSAGATSGGSAATRIVQTSKGAIKVPATAHRIVTIQPAAFSTLIDLGDADSIVGVYDEGTQYVSPRYRALYDKTAKIGDKGQVDLEKILNLKPDLIVGADFDWNTKNYQQLSAIAPMVVAPVDSWQSMTKAFAEAVGRTDQMQALSAQLTTKQADIKKQYAPQLAKYKWDILQGGFDPGQYWIYGPGSDVGSILAGAGVQFATASTQTPADDNRSVSYEQISLLNDADVIGYYSDSGSSAPTNNGPQLFAQAGFKALPAVKAQRVVAIPDFLPGGYGDALAVLDELTAGLKTLPAAS